MKKNKVYKTWNYKTVKDMFERSTTAYENDTFIYEKNNPKVKFEEISFGQFRKDVIGFGTALNEILHLKNSKIVVIGETNYHWYVSYMSILCGVGIFVPVDKDLPKQELGNIIKRANAEAIIYTDKKSEIVEETVQDIDTVKYLIKMKSNNEFNGNKIGMSYLINEGTKLVASGNNSYMEQTIKPEDFAMLLFTSGTTGIPKGVMISNKNLAQNINSMTEYVDYHHGDKFLSILPLHHTYESSVGFLAPFSVGASIAICQGLRYIVPNLLETNPTILIVVPEIVETLYKKINAGIKEQGKENLVNTMIKITNFLDKIGIHIKRKVFKSIYEKIGGNVRIICAAAAPIDPKVGKWIHDIGITFLQGYGLTETAPITAVTPDFDLRIGSAGKVVLCDEVKIDNPNESGEGEILIKGDTLMMGYYEDEEANKQAIIDGWFHSGDIGYLDKDNYIYITGRCKNVIVTQNGKNVYPEEIEMVLNKLPEIKECMVYGKEDPKLNKGLIVTVKVIPDHEEIEKVHGPNLKEEEIYNIIWNKIKEVNQTMVSYKAIKKLEIKKGEFIKTTTMKIKRQEEIANGQ